MILNDGSTYHPGQGREMARALPTWSMNPAELAVYIDEAKQAIAHYGRVPGATIDLFVADLITRHIVVYGPVALALLDEESFRARP